jgi:SpoIIAA-like
VKVRIEPRGGYLFAELEGRETAHDMREYLLAVKAACLKHDCPRILLSIRASRPMFKAEDYGLSGAIRGYANELVKPACRIALVGDSSELNFAHEYIEVVARQQQVNVKSFKEASSAVRWLQDVPAAKTGT